MESAGGPALAGESVEMGKPESLLPNSYSPGSTSCSPAIRKLGQIASLSDDCEKCRYPARCSSFRFGDQYRHPFYRGTHAFSGLAAAERESAIPRGSLRYSRGTAGDTIGPGVAEFLRQQRDPNLHPLGSKGR